MVSPTAAWLAGASCLWVVAGAPLGSVIPFTLIVILPTNKQLLNPTLDRRSEQAGQLLARWGKLHAVRSVLSALALLLLLYLAVFTKSVGPGKAKMVKSMRGAGWCRNGWLTSRA